ncbi:MAG: T9SS type A sorting domain-containing protein [Bacteroidales bacterium]|nr:T9SS type A sorting domain-containing protein [Bacteroidales bacterium]
MSITNLTKGWQETIYWPDTTLTMQNGTGIADVEIHGRVSLQMSQNNPNPFTGTTEVNLMVANEGTVALDIADINGRIVVVNDYALQAGSHQFRITLATAGTYVMTTRQSGQTSSIKMVCNGGGNGNRIEYTGTVLANDYSPQPVKSSFRVSTTNPFTFGDQMEYVGFASINCIAAESQHITQVQEASQTFTLQFSETQHQLPIVTTNTITSITANSATCGGDVTSNGASSVTARGVCWSTSQNPTVSESYTTDGSGTGSFTSNITGLTTGTTYYVRAYATNSAGTSYGEQRSFTAVVDAGYSCPGAATVTDYDNNTYNTVQIGNQCWMKKNLRTTHYSDGTSIPLGSSTSNTTAYYYVDNNISNVSTYGYLYNWPAVMGNSSSSSANPSGVQGICPTGWHVPSDAEWIQLSDYVGSQTQYQCGANSAYIAKALASTSGWAIIMSNLCAVGLEPSSNNSTGFSALPAGCYGSNLSSFGSDADFWSATQIYGNFVYYRQITYSGAYLYRNANDKSYGYSVRCLRD